jgi:hypothetical protein
VYAVRCPTDVSDRPNVALPLRAQTAEDLVPILVTACTVQYCSACLRHPKMRWRWSGGPIEQELKVQLVFTTRVKFISDP